MLYLIPFWDFIIIYLHFKDEIKRTCIQYCNKRSPYSYKKQRQLKKKNPTKLIRDLILKYLVVMNFTSNVDEDISPNVDKLRNIGTV